VRLRLSLLRQHPFLRMMRSVSKVALGQNEVDAHRELRWFHPRTYRWLAGAEE